MTRILVVDDEFPIRKLLKRILEAADYDCDVAEDVPAAKKLLGSRPFQLLLTDIIMPGESGLDLVRHVKQKYPDTAPVIVSSIDDPAHAAMALDLNVYGYIIKPFDQNQVMISVQNALIRRNLELAATNRQAVLERRFFTSEEKNRRVLESIGIGVALIGPDLNFLELNRQMREWFPYLDSKTRATCYQTYHSPEQSSPCDDCPILKTFSTGAPQESVRKIFLDGEKRYFRIASSPLRDPEGKVTACIKLMEDITEKQALERELRQAQKLESIGQLAAGIAHEINNPIQYVGDNIKYFKSVFADLFDIVNACEALLAVMKSGSPSEEQAARLQGLLDDADVEYLQEDIDQAMTDTVDGVGRVRKIVNSMRVFSHPGTDEKTAADINRALDSTITVARNEWKYVAEVKTDFDDELPMVTCLPGEINQVFLNLLVNAAQAIEEKLQDAESGMGLITISTRRDGDAVEIRFSDSGGGIPESVQDHIFDPFFTTKAVGKGTGQGLAIAYNVITEKHGGMLKFETRQDAGTTFIIRLPIHA